MQSGQRREVGGDESESGVKKKKKWGTQGGKSGEKEKLYCFFGAVFFSAYIDVVPLVLGGAEAFVAVQASDAAG
jgi:hypothetical protein